VHTGFLLGKPEENRPLKDPDLYGDNIKMGVQEVE
jgi:hypothetical protein